MIQAVVVDDDLDIAPVIQRAGEKAGVDVKMFANGTAALNYLNEKDSQADVVLLDLMMAPLDGLTVAEEIRRNEEIHTEKPPVKMAFLTAAVISDAVDRIAERVGIEKIFVKPCDYVSVFEEIKQWFPNGR